MFNSPFQYLGYEEVKEARGVKVCSNAVAKLIKDKKNVSFFFKSEGGGGY